MSNTNIITIHRNNHRSKVHPTTSTITNNIDKFSSLQLINAILTNKCNLACSYCYEQHHTDYGKFTPESLIALYRFLVDINEQPNKLFQLFGGEPLLHKKLILQFLDRYSSELESGLARGVGVGIVTNATIFDQEFSSKWHSYTFTRTFISLDTLDPLVDHRTLTDAHRDTINQTLATISPEDYAAHRVGIRCTISEETVSSLKDFLTTLYGYGVRLFVVHPLTMSAAVGYVNWSDSNWDLLYSTISSFIRDTDAVIDFAEGVGTLRSHNCMVGSDMIAVDPSGDFTGCYFFTNQKETLPNTVLGNVFTDTLNVQVYDDVMRQYNTMFDADPRCQTCDMQQLCYQCPAGNITSSGQMFRSDEMCQRIVGLHQMVKHDGETKKRQQQIMQWFNQADGGQLDYTISVVLLDAWFRMSTTQVPDSSVVHHLANKLRDSHVVYGQVAAAVAAWIAGSNVESISVDAISVHKPITCARLYGLVLESTSTPSQSELLLAIAINTLALEGRQ